jgi:hypothetical protein
LRPALAGLFSNNLTEETMRIVIIQPGITKFMAFKGNHGVTQNIDLNIIQGIPFDAPDELATARIKASPNLFRVATEEDEAFAKIYKAKRIAELNELIKEKEKDEETLKSEIESLKEKVKNPGKLDQDDFNVADFIVENDPLTQEKLEDLERDQLVEVGQAVELEFPKNIPSAKLIQLILEKVQE